MNQLAEYKQPTYLPSKSIYEEKKKHYGTKDIDEDNNESEVYIYFGSAELKYNKYPVTFSIRSHKFTLKYELKHIASYIVKSKYLLELKDDWDDENSLSTNLETYLKAVKFIIDYSSYIFEDKGSSVIIEPPDIDILKDGAIVVNWETKSASFTIIFEKNSTGISYYYAKDKDNPIPLRYGINLNKDIDKLTASWMSNNLKYKEGIYFP